MNVFFCLILAVFLGGCFAESYPHTPWSQEYRYDPITLSLEDLRAPILPQPPGQIKVNGKIVVYGDYLLVNEPKEGVHFFDNSDPSSPKALFFLPILGIKDVTVKNNLLYADSYIDLLTFDISVIGDVKLLHRLEGVFEPPYKGALFNVDEREFIVIDYVWVANT